MATTKARGPPSVADAGAHSASINGQHFGSSMTATTKLGPKTNPNRLCSTTTYMDLNDLRVPLALPLLTFLQLFQTVHLYPQRPRVTITDGILHCLVLVRSRSGIGAPILRHHRVHKEAQLPKNNLNQVLHDDHDGLARESAPFRRRHKPLNF
ncbi:hypothetical protein K439DRAFT_611753 [Ramaria rubella]|nr:hypothetical protein K439DRAFT_611753 [Ramaria rubella]